MDGGHRYKVETIGCYVGIPLWCKSLWSTEQLPFLNGAQAGEANKVDESMQVSGRLIWHQSKFQFASQYLLLCSQIYYKGWRRRCTFPWPPRSNKCTISKTEQAIHNNKRRRESSGERKNPAKKGRKCGLSAYEVAELIQAKKIASRLQLMAFAGAQDREGKKGLSEFICNREGKVVDECLAVALEFIYSGREVRKKAEVASSTSTGNEGRKLCTWL